MSYLEKISNWVDDCVGLLFLIDSLDSVPHFLYERGFKVSIFTGRQWDATNLWEILKFERANNLVKIEIDKRELIEFHILVTTKQYFRKSSKIVPKNKGPILI